MAIDFRNVKDWTIPEGNVVKVTDSSRDVIWRKYAYTFLDYVTCETSPTGIIVPINIPTNSSWDIMMDYAYTGPDPGTSANVPNSASVSFMGGEATNTDKAGFFQYKSSTYSQSYAITQVWWNLTGSNPAESNLSSAARLSLSNIGDRHMFRWSGTKSSASCIRTDVYSNTTITSYVSSYAIKQNWSGYWGFGLFATYEGVPQSSSYGQFVGNIYGCYIKINGEDVYNFIPAMRNKDEVYGLYDTVNDVFYPSASSNAFTHLDIPVRSVELTNTNVAIGQSKNIPYKIRPGAATNRNLSWTINDSVKATIDENTGLVTGQSYGSTTATATALDGSNVSGSCTVLSYVPTTGITLNPTYMQVAVDGESILTPVITPSNATFKTVTWTTSGPSSAGAVTVTSNDNGTASVIGVRKSNLGNKITITGTAYDGQTATCQVEVYEGTVDAEDVTLNADSITLTVGQSYNLIATVSPNDASNKTVTWSSSNSSIASVSSSGVVTANAIGNCTITVTTNDRGWTDTCRVYVVDELHSLTIVPTPSTATVKFNGVVAGTGTQSINAVPGEAVSYEVSLNGYQTVNGVYTMGNADDTLPITLNPVANPVTKITLNKTSAVIESGTTLQLSATVSPSNAANKTVTWDTSDQYIARVDSSTGLVTGVGNGTCTITCSATDGSGVTASCNVTVYTFDILTEPITISSGQTATISGELLPSNVSITGQWVSSNTSVATVSKSNSHTLTGVEYTTVTARTPGTAYIGFESASLTNPLNQQTCTVTVTAATTDTKSVTIYNPTEYTAYYGFDNTTSSSLGPGESDPVDIEDGEVLYIARSGSNITITIDRCDSNYRVRASAYEFGYDDIVDGDLITLSSAV